MVGQRKSREPRGKDQHNQVVQEIMTVTEGLACSDTSEDGSRLTSVVCLTPMSHLNPLSTRSATKDTSK